MIRKVSDLFKRIRLDLRSGLAYPPTSGGVSRLGEQSKILIEYFGGPSTGKPSVKYIQLQFIRYSNSGRWEITYQENPVKPVGSQSVDYLEKNYSSFESLMKEVDVKALFNELYRGAIVQMVARLPVYAAVMNRFKLVENKSAGTLYVTFNQIMLSYEIHYNPQFIVETMVQHAFSNYFSDEIDMYEDLTGYVALMFSHEMEHILRANLGAGGQGAQAIEGVDHELANLVSDSLINQRLSKVFMQYRPTIGIMQDLHTTFVVPKAMVGRGDVKLYETVTRAARESFKGVRATSYKMDRSRNIINGTVGKITTIINEDLISLYNDNSNELTKDLDKFFRQFSGTLSMDDIGKMLSGSSSDLQEAADKSPGPITVGISVPQPNTSSDDQGDRESGQPSGAGSDSGTSGQKKSEKKQSSGEDKSTAKSSKNQQTGSSNGKEGSGSGSGGGDTSGLGAGSGGGEDLTKPKPVDSMTDHEKAVAKSVLEDIIDGAQAPELTEEEKR